MKKYIYIGLALFVSLCSACFFNQEMVEAKDKKKKEAEFVIPSHVVHISKENTYPNPSEDQEIVEQSDSTKELIQTVDIPIENPELIKLLNETSVKPSPIALGYRGMVYLGRWPLHYDSIETSSNWRYQEVNKNELHNQGIQKNQKLRYHQEEEKKIKGALTNKIANPEQIKQMILLKAKKKTNLPLAYEATIGKGTRKEQSFAVPPEKHGYLHAYAPAISEKGTVTFGEVYIQLKGTKKHVILKNITKQGIGAWIPIQDYLSFTFQTT